MERDKVAIVAFFSALLLIGIMLVSTLINVSDIVKLKKEIKNDNSNTYIEENDDNYVEDNDIDVENEVKE